MGRGGTWLAKPAKKGFRARRIGPALAHDRAEPPGFVGEYHHRNQKDEAMAKKRKKAARRPARKSARRGKSNPDSTVNALVILVVIALAFAGYYLYQSNAKPKGALLDTVPAMTSVETA